MDKFDNILSFLDGLDNGRVIAQTIRNERENIEGNHIPESMFNQDIKKQFEVFLNDYALLDHYDEMKLLLIIGQYANGVYKTKSRHNQRLTKDRIDAPYKNNKPLKRNLEELKNANFGRFNPNDNLNAIKNKYGDPPIKNLNPVTIHSIAISIDGVQHTINSPEICRKFEHDLSKLIYKYLRDGKLDELEKLPSKSQIKEHFARDYIVPVYCYLKTIWPGKSQTYAINATLVFWSIFSDETYDVSTFRKIIKG
mgnify:CR=1 FL=1